jgi:hypothetical protein
MKKISLGANGNGTHTVIHVDDDELITRDIMPAKNVQSILDANAEFRARGRKPNPAAHGRLAASIPSPVYATWRKDWAEKYRDDWTWKTYLVMKLNTRDYSYLKTNELHL